MGGAGLCASPRCSRPLALSPSRPCLPTPQAQGSGRARFAHMLVSAVRAPSCMGRLPLRLLSRRNLRARGAPVGGEMGEREGVEGRGRRGPCMGGAGAVCQPWVLSPSRPLAPASPTPRAGQLPSAVCSHARQRGEGAELRGQAAAQAVVAKRPARPRCTGGMWGEGISQGWEVVGRQGRWTHKRA